MIICKGQCGCFRLSRIEDAEMKLVTAAMVLLIVLTGCRAPEPLHFTDAEMESMAKAVVYTNSTTGAIYFPMK